MWKRVAVVFVVLVLAVGVWAGFREMRRDACFGSGGGQALNAYEGVTVAEAEARAERENQIIRVVGRDGACADRTGDLRTDRVDVYVEDGDVVRARRPS